MSEIGEQAAEMADRLRGQAARLASAAEAATEATAEAACTLRSDGAVSVTATGGGQVRAVSIDPRAMRVPLPELGAAAARSVNQAIAAARDKAARAAADATGSPGGQADRGAAGTLDPDAERFASRLAGELVSGSSANRQVTVTANGTGEILQVRIESAASRERDGRLLGERIAAASNGALDAARRLQRSLLESARPGEELRAAAADDLVRRHERQMTELLDRLAETERSIGDW